MGADNPTQPRDPEPDPESGPDVTRLLGAVAVGDAAARGALLDVVYDELRVLAGQIFSGQRADHTLQPTALVHEAYLKLVNAGGEYENRRHFMAVAAKAMRQVLINHARAQRAEKRGGTRVQMTLDPDLTPLPGSDIDVLELEEALERLERIDADQARVVELRFYGGLTVEETAQVMETSESTVKREWRMARAELMLLLEGDDGAA
jgi:RNA polymerase sigma factor (TIGR02999 family)